MQKVTSWPASSCHLWYYGLRDDDISDTWTLECTVNVKESRDCTYFCVVGWGPGGYSGIQQINSERRVVIFSMWNDDSGCGDVKVSRAKSIHLCKCKKISARKTQPEDPEMVKQFVVECPENKTELMKSTKVLHNCT